MSKLAAHLSASRSLLAALEVIGNRRAFLTLFLTLLGGMLFSALLSYVSMSLLAGGSPALASLAGLLIGLLMLGLFLLGGSTCGHLVNDQMRAREVRSLGSALMAALLTLHRFLAVGALLFLIGLAVLLALALLLLLCKIPVLGPLLYALVFPLGAFVLGVLGYSFLFVAALAGPAIWEGHTAVQTLALLWAIVRKKLLAVVVQVILLGMLAAVIGGLIMGALLLGLGMTSGLSAGILSIGRGSFGFPGMMHGLGAAGGYVVAAGIGGGLLMAAAMVVPMLVVIAGNCLIFAGVSEDLDAQAMEAALAAQLSQARQKLEENRRAADALPPSEALSTPVPRQCAHCRAVVGTDDRFCGECGHRLDDAGGA